MIYVLDLKGPSRKRGGVLVSCEVLECEFYLTIKIIIVVSELNMCVTVVTEGSQAS